MCFSRTDVRHFALELLARLSYSSLPSFPSCNILTDSYVSYTESKNDKSLKMLSCEVSFLIFA